MANISSINSNPIVLGTGGLSDGAVTSAKLANSSVISNKLADSSVTSDKIANSGVTEAKIGVSAVSTGKIADLSVTTSKLANNSVTASKLADNAIGGAKLVNGSIYGAKIATGTISTANLADGAVTDIKLSTARGQALDKIAQNAGAIAQNAEAIAQNTSDKVPYPTGTYSKHGESGQVLRSNGDGTTRWEYEELPSEQAMDASIKAWLNEHPEATTTVLDGAVTPEKLGSGTVRQFVRVYDTASDMTAADDLVSGMVVRTNGFYSAGDGGASYYAISSQGAANGMDILACGELVASLISDGEGNVKQLGAVGDGETDDAAVLSRAIEIFATIVVLDNLAISHVSMAGVSDKMIDGRGVGSMVSISQMQKMLSNKVDGSEPGMSNVVIQNLSFVGSGYYTGSTWNADSIDCCIDVIGASNCTVCNCHFSQFGALAIRLSNGVHNTIENNVIENNIDFSGGGSLPNYNGGIGIGGSNHVVRNNVVTGCIQCIYAGPFVKGVISGNTLASVYQHCVYFGKGSDSIITNNNMDATSGILCVKLQHDAADSTPMEKVTISDNNLVGGSDQAILVTELHNDTERIKDIIITGNNIVARRGIQCSKTNNVVIANNIVRTSQYGIFVAQGKQVSVYSCNVLGAGNQTEYGINIDGVGDETISIAACRIENTRYGISMANIRQIKVSGCVISGVGTGILTSAAATSATLILTDNAFMLDMETYTQGTSIGYCVRTNGLSEIVAKSNLFEKSGSGIGDGLVLAGLSKAGYLVGNVSTSVRYGFRRSPAIDALVSKAANLWTELVG